jgi:L-arabinokinase
MGGIADYSGSLVLQRTIAEATHVTLRHTDESVIDVVSGTRAFSLPLSALSRDGGPIGYDEAQKIFHSAETRWASYVIGVFVVLMREQGVTFSHGANIRVSSEVPEGKGVASSAALEVAVMQAVAAAFDIPITAMELALLCQKVENRVAGCLRFPFPPGYRFGDWIPANVMRSADRTTRPSVLRHSWEAG